MKAEIEKILAGGGNYIGSIHNYEIKIDSINTEYFSLSALPEMLNQDMKSDDCPPETPVSECISEDIIPPSLQGLYTKLTPKQKLVCLAIVYLQTVKEGGKNLFRNDNDWWAVYSPLVYDEGFPSNPGSLFTALEELGMGMFNVNCDRDYMVKINGVFLKNYHDWKEADYYGERLHVYWHKKKIADKLGEILRQLHKQMEI